MGVLNYPYWIIACPIMWSEITYPFPNFNGCMVEAWEYEPTIYNWCNYWSILGLKLNHVSKTAPDIWHKKRFFSFTWGRPQPTIESLTFMLPSLFGCGHSHVTCEVPTVPVGPAGKVNSQAYFVSKWLMLYQEDMGYVYLQILTTILA